MPQPTDSTKTSLYALKVLIGLGTKEDYESILDDLEHVNPARPLQIGPLSQHLALGVLNIAIDESRRYRDSQEKQPESLLLLQELLDVHCFEELLLARDTVERSFSTDGFTWSPLFSPQIVKAVKVILDSYA